VQSTTTFYTNFLHKCVKYCSNGKALKIKNGQIKLCNLQQPRLVSTHKIFKQTWQILHKWSSLKNKKRTKLNRAIRNNHAFLGTFFTRNNAIQKIFRILAGLNFFPNLFKPDIVTLLISSWVFKTAILKTFFRLEKQNYCIIIKHCLPNKSFKLLIRLKTKQGKIVPYTKTKRNGWNTEEGVQKIVKTFY
jgi:hypothetical protein